MIRGKSLSVASDKLDSPSFARASTSSTLFIFLYFFKNKFNLNAGEVSYTLTPSSAPFYIDTSSGVIRVKTSLDRESVDNYTLTVTASDRDPNIADVKSSSVNLTISLNDINDNDPVFSLDHYKVTI